MKKNSYEKINEIVDNSKLIYQGFYAIGLLQNMRTMRYAMLKHVIPADRLRCVQSTYGLDRKAFRELQTESELDYSPDTWVTLVSLSHQLLIANEKDFPEKKPRMQAHFEYCCRNLMSNCEHQNTALDAIYHITADDHKHIKALKANASVLDLHNWKQV